MSRVSARESVYKLVFEFLFSGEVNKRTFELFCAAEEDPVEVDYIKSVYTGVIDNYDELIALISKYSEGFSVDRIYKPDLAALLVATYEMKYMKEIPNSVSIAEAVVLVKRFSTEKSNQYVNGLLSGINKSLTAEASK